MDLLAIYVEDHLALSLGGIRLARRALAENRGTPYAEFLDRLLPELEDDRAVLEDVARALGGARSVLKEVAVVAGEYVGRLKLNGKLFSYSDLSRVWELEGLMAGSESRRGLLKVLARARKKDPRLQGFDFEALEERAKGHREELEHWRLRAADIAFGTGGKRTARVAGPAHVPR